MLMRPYPMQRSSIITKVIIVLSLVIFLFVLSPVVVSAQTGSVSDRSVNFGLEDAKGIGLGQTDLKTIIANIVRWLLGLLGIILVIIIMYGGFVWMTASGDPAKIDKAKQILTNAIIGLIIIMSAFAIVSFIISRFGAETGDSGTSQRPPIPPSWGIGSGPVESVFPEPFAQEVPINTWIAVTFKESVKPDSICDTNGAYCDGDLIKDSVEICELSAETGFCETAGAFKISDFADTTVINREGDNKTYVFTVNNKYLGANDGIDRTFQVRLKDGILRVSDNMSIFTGISDYSWQFTTNGELDIDPPEIVSTISILNPENIPNVSGVYPDPDGLADEHLAGAPATPTQFNFSVGSGTINSKISATYDSVATAVNPGDPNASVTGAYAGDKSGVVTVTVDGGNVPTVIWPDSTVHTDSSYPTDLGRTNIDIGPYGLIFTPPAKDNQGKSWTFSVTAEQAGDRIELRDNASGLSKDYYFGPGWDIPIPAIGNAVTEIINDNIGIFRSCGIACISTESAGRLSQRYDLIFVDQNINENSIIISKTNGGDELENITQNGRRDIYRNAIFQINFNEAVNPIFINNNIRVYYDRDYDDGALNYSDADNNSDFGSGDGPSLTNNLSDEVTNFEVAISNQYRTVELRSNVNCGVTNACGDDMFCWPINKYADPTSNDYNSSDYDHKATLFEIEVVASSLRTCTNDNDCRDWGGECEVATSRCVKDVDGKQVYFPGVEISSVDGIIDMSGNSLNGNFNSYIDPDPDSGKIFGIAEGQTEMGPGKSNLPDPFYLFYNNPISLSYVAPAPPPNFGDNFKWRFWVSDKIDTQSPLIKSVDPISDEMTTNLKQPVKLIFDKLIRSSTLKPGWNYGSQNDFKSRSQRYLVLDTITPNANPVGYWVGKYNNDSNGDGYPDYTNAFIRHSKFAVATEYGPLAGSGIESITQNCFLPGGGPVEAGATGSNNCHYDESTVDSDDDTVGCVRDVGLGAGQVKLPNPASFGKINCEDIVGAVVCDVSRECKVLYYDGVSGSETDLMGSWIITDDYPIADVNNKTGCCFGRCQ